MILSEMSFCREKCAFSNDFLPSAGFSYGLYVLTENLTVRGLFPLLFPLFSCFY